MRQGIQRLSIMMLILLSMTMLLITGCDKGKLKTNQSPEISITSYEGADLSTADSLAIDSLLAALPEQSFQAKIFWKATDKDGTVKGFAFRILDLDGKPISTPGFSFIDETGALTPDEVKAAFPNKFGWVLHLKPGETLPLSSPDSKKTIWTSNKYALINFPAADSNGNPLPKISKFEIICIDNRNAISNVAVRYFNATSAKPNITLTTSKGNPNGGVVGTGLKLNFGINDYDPFLTSIATHYEFAMYKRNITTNVVTPAGTDTVWISTANEEKINEYEMHKTTSQLHGNLLVPDFDSTGVQKTETIIYAHAFDLAGIKSDVKSIKFAVKEGFRPQTIVYHQRVIALGDYHFIDYIDDSTPEVLPSVFTSTGPHYATPFFKDTLGRFTAVNSQNLKVTLRWGWHGEYGTTSTAGVITTTDDPFDRKQDNVLDSLNTNYYSEITKFHLRLDNQPYNFPPLATHIITDGDGKRWLEVSLTDPISQALVLTNLSTGKHVFEVRAMDLQGEVDQTPATFTFYLIDSIPASQRNNVLIIDDDPNNTNFAPDAVVDTLYAQFIADELTQYGLTKTQIDRQAIPVWSNNLIESISADIRNRKVAYSDIQKYKMVIYHSDGGYLTSEFDKEHDAFSLYLRNGGNMVVSGGQNLQPINQVLIQKGQDLLYRYFGVGYSLTSITAVQSGNSFILKPWFIKAVSLTGTSSTDINVELTSPFNSLVNARHGLGPVSTITQKTDGATYLFGYGSKTVGQDSYSPPTQADYEAYNGKPVAIKNATTNNKCYLFTFPLAYMKVADMKNTFNDIFTVVFGAK